MPLACASQPARRSGIASPFGQHCVVRVFPGAGDFNIHEHNRRTPVSTCMISSNCLAVKGSIVAEVNDHDGAEPARCLDVPAGC